MEKTFRNIVVQYLALRFISSFGTALISATYVTFLLTKGLNLFEVNLVNFVFFTTLFISEIPTGAFADVFGRKLSFVLSCFITSAGMFIYSAANSFWFFAIAEATAALGSTFSSGAFQAWLVDRLENLGYQGPMERIFSKEQQIKSASAIIAAILGAFASDLNMSLPWILGGLIAFIAGSSAAIFMKEEKVKRHRTSFKKGVQNMRKIVNSSLKYSQENNSVRFLLTIGIVQYFAVQAPNMQWQPFFMHFLNDKSSLGFIFSGISVAIIFGSYLAPKISRRIKNEKAIIVTSEVIVGLGICSTILLKSIVPAVTVFLIHEAARGLINPLKDTYFNNNIPSNERATLLSFEALSHHLGGMIGLLVSGFLAEYFSLKSAWISSGLILVIFVLIFSKKGKGNPEKQAAR